MQKWEYLFVFAAITSEGGEFRPRFANDQELDDWQQGLNMYDYANRMILLASRVFSIASEGKTRLSEKVLFEGGEINERRRRQHEREAETSSPSADFYAALF